MYNYNTGTPCPAPINTGRGFASPFESKQKQASIFDDTFDQYNDNTTQNIARLVQQEFKNAPPRRSHGLAQKPKRNAPISVFDDGSSQREPFRRDDSTRTMRGSAINARPAQRIRMQTTRDHQFFVTSASNHDISKAKPTAALGTGEIESENAAEGADRTKDDRRRTIWIPSDDTTIMSIHPGAYMHALSDDTIGLPAKDSKIIKETPRQAPTSKPSDLGMTSAMRHAQKIRSAAPKRGALNALAPSQPNAGLRDVLGSGGGKENIPPGMLLSRYGKDEKPLVKPSGKTAPLGARQSQSYMQQTATAQAKTANVKKRAASELKDAPKAKIAVTKDPRPLAPGARKVPTDSSTTKSFSRYSESQQPSRLAPPKLSIPDVRPSVSVNASRYPVLSDDLTQPALYEDNWLQHQEVALTQLVNSVFQQGVQSPAMPSHNVVALRGKLLSLYHAPSVATLQKRLKASLVYGALSMPKGAPNPPKLREDIGLRRQFLDVFVESYNLDALQAAAETVLGRLIPVNSRLSNASKYESSETSAVAQTKELRRFLLTFLIRHEDSVELAEANKVVPEEALALITGTAEWFWHRTVLRSLMLIHLLDQAKTTGVFSGCLFQHSSSFKSSVSVLQAFAKMVIPSVGDITRPLSHLDYTMTHVQQPLEEYTYRIDNIAVDLRNGVLLTRFVELLLYPPSSLNPQSDATVTFSLPDGETLTSIFDGVGNDSRILSQHLKFPCVSRAQKVHNVQVALSALAGICGLAGTAVENVKAGDIVDGHREKTLSLLWSLVSRWGLGFLVDWDELIKETRRFSSNTSDDSAYFSSAGDQPDVNEQGQLLKNWATNVCRHHDIPVTNLTTSFADGRALAAIITVYTQYLPASPQCATSTIKTRGKNILGEKLRMLGCSASFISLFASHTAIPSRSTTIALLAFLASRLLPLARTHRAASAIQRFYRLRLARRNISMHVQKMKAANEAALVAETKQREVDAAVTLQRAWRKVLDQRIANLERDVLAFQTLARGWGVRRACAGALGGASRRRVMGGW